MLKHFRFTFHSIFSNIPQGWCHLFHVIDAKTVIQSWHSLPKITGLVSLDFQSPFLPGQQCLFPWFVQVIPLNVVWCDSPTKALNSEVAQSSPTLCNSMDYSLPISSIHRIFQTRVLEWVAISFSRGSSQPRDQTQVSSITGRFFTS